MSILRIAAAVLLAVVLATTTARAADQVIFIVRHAEKEAAPAVQPPKNMMADNPPLSAAGRDRANRLATMLASAGIKSIYTSEFLRSRQTAAPLAEKLKIKSVMAAAKDPDPMLEQVRKAKGNVLIVGHANTVPEMLKALGVKDAITLGDNEYDNLFLVVRPASGEPTLVRLRY